MRKQIENLRRENSAFQVRLQQIITQLRDLQREKEEHLMVIRERETLTRDLTARVKSLESEKAEYLKTIQSLHDQINNASKVQEVQPLSVKKKGQTGKAKDSTPNSFLISCQALKVTIPIIKGGILLVVF